MSERIHRQSSRIHRRTTGERLHDRGIPSRDIIKSIPSTGALRGEARALVSKLIGDGYKKGINRGEIESLPPEYTGIRNSVILHGKEISEDISLRELTIRELFGRYSGANITNKAKFNRKIVGAVDEIMLKLKQEK